VKIVSTVKRKIVQNNEEYQPVHVFQYTKDKINFRKSNKNWL